TSPLGATAVWGAMPPGAAGAVGPRAALTEAMPGGALPGAMSASAGTVPSVEGGMAPASTSASPLAATPAALPQRRRGPLIAVGVAVAVIGLLLFLGWRWMPAQPPVPRDPSRRGADATPGQIGAGAVVPGPQGATSSQASTEPVVTPQPPSVPSLSGAA